MTDSDYQKYLFKLRERPSAVVLIANGNGFRTFDTSAWFAAAMLDRLRSVKMVNRHPTISLSANEAERMIAYCTVAYA